MPTSKLPPDLTTQQRLQRWHELSDDTPMPGEDATADQVAAAALAELRTANEATLEAAKYERDGNEFLRRTAKMAADAALARMARLQTRLCGMEESDETVGASRAARG